IFILAILTPSNPQSYDPNSFLFTVLFLCTAVALLLAAQLLLPPVAGERRRHWLLASARRELDRALSGRDRRWAPEAAMFRDPGRIGQIAAAAAGPQRPAILAEALSCFDQAAAIRLCDAGLARLTQGPLSRFAAAARAALFTRDPQRIRDAARALA